MPANESNAAGELRLHATIEIFTQLAERLADDKTSAEDLMLAHSAWLDCVTLQDCDQFIKLPLIAQRLDNYRRDKYFDDPAQVIQHVPDYLQNRPDLLDKALQKNYMPNYLIRSAEHVSGHAAAYAGGTALLLLLCFSQIKVLNPMHWFRLFSRALSRNHSPKSKIEYTELNQCVNK